MYSGISILFLVAIGVAYGGVWGITYGEERLTLWDDPPWEAPMPVIHDEEEPTWKVGEGLNIHDSYTYQICHSEHMVQEIYPSDCYIIRLEFIARGMHHVHGPIWIIQAEYNSKQTILFLDDAMQMHSTSIWDRNLASSLQETILHLSEYGEQSVQVGEIWGMMDTYYYEVPISITREVYGAAILEYSMMRTSSTILDPAVPFPVYSIWYDPNYIVPEPRINHQYALMHTG